MNTTLHVVEYGPLHPVVRCVCVTSNIGPRCEIRPCKEQTDCFDFLHYCWIQYTLFVPELVSQSAHWCLRAVGIKVTHIHAKIWNIAPCPRMVGTQDPFNTIIDGFCDLSVKTFVVLPTSCATLVYTGIGRVTDSPVGVHIQDCVYSTTLQDIRATLLARIPWSILWWSMPNHACRSLYKWWMHYKVLHVVKSTQHFIYLDAWRTLHLRRTIIKK